MTFNGLLTCTFDDDDDDDDVADSIYNCKQETEVLFGARKNEFCPLLPHKPVFSQSNCILLLDYTAAFFGAAAQRRPGPRQF